jgi:hypothetical protein
MHAMQTTGNCLARQHARKRARHRSITRNTGSRQAKQESLCIFKIILFKGPSSCPRSCFHVPAACLCSRWTKSILGTCNFDITPAPGTGVTGPAVAAARDRSWSTAAWRAAAALEGGRQDCICRDTRWEVITLLATLQFGGKDAHQTP